MHSGKCPLKFRKSIIAILFLVFIFSVEAVRQATAAGPVSRPATKPANPVTLPEFSRYLPIWTQGYLEVKNLSARLDQLIWLLEMTDDAAETNLSTRPKSYSTLLSEQFSQVLQSNLGISSDEFLKDLLGEYFVVGWGGLASPDQFGLICRVKNPLVISKLLTAGGAEVEDIPGLSPDAEKSNRYYRLRFPNIHAAVIDDRLLILATSARDAGALSMFHSMITLVRGTSPALNHHVQFKSACADIPANYSALIVLLTRDRDKAIGNGFEQTLFNALQKNANYLAIAAYPHSDSLTVRVNVQPRWIDSAFLPTRSVQVDPVMRNMISPTLDFVYVSEVEPYRWYRRIVDLAEQNQRDARQYRGMVELVLPDPQMRETLLESLGPEIMVAVSSSAGSTPAIAIVLKSANPTLTLSATDQMFAGLAAFASLQKLAGGRGSVVEPMKQETYQGFSLRRQSFGQVIAPTAGNHFTGLNLELAWAQVDNYLILSTSQKLLYQLIDRAFDKAADRPTATANFMHLPEASHWAMSLAPNKLAGDLAIVRNVLRTLNRIRLLGIGMKVIKRPDSEDRVVQVAKVLPETPAWNRMRTGDLIVGVDGRQIDPVAPQKDLHHKVSDLVAQDRDIKLQVIRDGKKIDVAIPVQHRDFIDTLKAMRLLSRILNVLGQRFEQIQIACNYSPTGKIHLEFVFNPVLQPTTTRAVNNK